jgi:ABC-2 type transport system permease protein
MSTAGPVLDSHAVTDSLVLVWRNLKRLPRQPDMVVYGTIQPIMFVVLFAYVFGGSISVGGTNDASIYREFLMGGIFAQTMAFSVASSSVGLADDMNKGLIERFRSLPIARGSVITGRVVGDLTFNAFVLLVMVACGFAVGWRIRGSLWEAGLAFLILLGFTFAMLWIGALIGLSVRSVEVASSAGLIWLFPLTFISSCFVDPSYMPGWMQPIAEWNPISAVALAVRDLFGNPVGHTGDGFPSDHPVLLSVLYIAAITAVFSWLAVRKYQRTTGR